MNARPLSLLAGTVAFAAFALIALFSFFPISASAAPARERKRAPLNVEVLLNSIAAVESENNPRAIGKKGERGRCQFMQTTWVGYTNAPFLSFASIDCEVTRRVEKAHLSWVCGQLTGRGHPLEPALIAAAWRWGPTRAARHIRDDASVRVANLYFAWTQGLQ